MKKKVIDIRIGGETRPLSWDNLAILDFEEAATFRLEDGTVLKASAAGAGGMRLESVRDYVACITAALKAGARARQAPEPAFNDVKRWLADDDAMTETLESVMDVIGENSPQPEDLEAYAEEEGDDGAPDPPQTAATGSETPTHMHG